MDPRFFRVPLSLAAAALLGACASREPAPAQAPVAPAGELGVTNVQPDPEAETLTRDELEHDVQEQVSAVDDAIDHLQLQKASMDDNERARIDRDVARLGQMRDRLSSLSARIGTVTNESWPALRTDTARTIAAAKEVVRSTRRSRIDEIH